MPEGRSVGGYGLEIIVPRVDGVAGDESPATGVGADNQPSASDQQGYEIRDQREAKDSRPSIAAWLPDWHWPVAAGGGCPGGAGACFLIRKEPRRGGSG